MVAALALVAGCNKGPESNNPAARADTPPPQAQVKPGSHEEKKDGANPQRGG